MMKAFLRCCALACLCLLLVYAPEIFTAVSGPYQRARSERALLRIALCAQDDQTVSSLYKTISGYQKQHPMVHLRITRADAQQILALPSPLPDVYFFPESLSPSLSALLLPQLHPYSVPDGEDLVCGVSRSARLQKNADEFVAYIHEAASAQTPVPDF